MDNLQAKYNIYRYRAVVDRIVDGDTFDATIDLGFSIKFKIRFRVDAYDAPETFRPKSEAEKEHGKQATARAEQLMLGKEVIIESTKTAGIYGRYGARVFLPEFGGEQFSEIMVQEGYAKKDDYSKE